MGSPMEKPEKIALLLSAVFSGARGADLQAEDLPEDPTAWMRYSARLTGIAPPHCAQNFRPSRSSAPHFSAAHQIPRKLRYPQGAI
jgi:hypothetical protein